VVISRSHRQFPTFAERWLHPFVGFFDVGHLALGGVPQQLAFVVNGHRTEQQPFGIIAGDAEI